MRVGIATINTLTVFSTKPFTREEYTYLNALKYLFECFNGMENDNSFSMFIDKNTFLLANKRHDRELNPIVFVNQKGEILLDVDIKVFQKAIKEFNIYIDYYKNKSIPYEKKVQLAIKDYKNDKLDFYSNSPVVFNSLIEKAEQAISEHFGRNY